MHTGSVSQHINASPAAVWAVLADLTRMGEWSPETYRVEWLGSATGPVAGARFRGWNKRGFFRYPTTCEIEVVDTDRELAWAVVLRGQKVTRWRYQLAGSEQGGTEVTESYEQAMAYGPIARISFSDKRVAAMHEGMRTTLRRLASAVEGSGSSD